MGKIIDWLKNYFDLTINSRKLTKEETDCFIDGFFIGMAIGAVIGAFIVLVELLVLI